MARSIPTFTDFRHGPGGAMARALDVGLDGCQTWQDYTAACSRVPGFHAAAEREGYTASTGERAVLCALLHAADHAALADQVADGRTWARMGLLDRAHTDAVLACVARVDP